MSSVEVLKRIKQDNYLTGVQLPAFSQDEANRKRIKSMRERDNALDEAIVALEQKDKIIEFVEALKHEVIPVQYYNRDKGTAIPKEVFEKKLKRGFGVDEMNDEIDFIRLEILPKNKKKQYRVFFKDGTEQVFPIECRV